MITTRAPDGANNNDRYIYRTTSKSNLWDFWPLIYLIRVMRKHDLTNKKKTTNTKTNTMTMTNTLREHPKWGIFGDILRTSSNGNPREVLSLTNKSLSDPTRPNWWGLTKFHNFGQISQSQPNFTILEYLEYLELEQFRNFFAVFSQTWRFQTGGTRLGKIPTFSRPLLIIPTWFSDSPSSIHWHDGKGQSESQPKKTKPNWTK